jgi:long-chain acyl-CoA synthetase
MHPPWLKSYPPGVPAAIDPAALQPLDAMFLAACQRHAGRVAYVSMGQTLTYAQLAAQSRAFAGWLQSRGLQKGERVALMLPNLLQYPVAFFGTLLAGGVVVNCNPLTTPRELDLLLQDTQPTVLVTIENFAHVVEQVSAQDTLRHVIVSSVGELLTPFKGRLVDFVLRHIKRVVPSWHLPGAVRFRDALAQGEAHGFQPPQLTTADLALLQATGGTTGLPKAAMLTHGNMAANVTQALAWLKPVVREGEECIVTALPLFHVFALTANCLSFLMLGAKNVLIANARDIPSFIKEWRKHPVTVVTGVNTLFNALLNHADFARLDFSTLRITLGGGMAVQAPVAQRWQQVTGVAMLQAYGLTECAPAVTIDPLDLPAFNGAIGLPMPSTELEIRDDAGHALALGEIGEICVRGPQVMPGYWQRPEETAAAFHADGFLRTGDLGLLDAAGYVYLVDRKKDVILVSGFNVYPNEVEEAVALHPGILEAAAISVPDTHSGEAVKIFAVRRDPALTEAALIAHCRSVLTGYKVPRQVEFRDSLPHTTVGKILRRALKP